MRGWIWLERGALPEARDDFESALAFVRDVALPPAVTKASAAMLALVLAEQGELAHADDLLERHGVAGELPEQQVMNLHPALPQPRARAAGPDGGGARGRARDRPPLRAARPPPRRAAVALAGGGLTGDEALAREELELAQRWGTPLALGLAERGLGLVTQDEAALRRAVAELERAPNRLELARTQRRARRDPAPAGAAAPTPASRCAPGWTARTRAAPSRSPSAPAPSCWPPARGREGSLSRASEALTPSERRVTDLAANGLTNRQIAQELFVTMATVETHLRHAFRKLDVSSSERAGGRGAQDAPGVTTPVS